MTSPFASRDGFKLLVPHKDDCLYSDRDNPFVLHDGMEWSRRRNGAKNGGWAWHRFRCNDPGCPAIVIVRIDALCDWIGRG